MSRRECDAMAESLRRRFELGLWENRMTMLKQMIPVPRQMPGQRRTRNHRASMSESRRWRNALKSLKTTEIFCRDPLRFLFGVWTSNWSKE